MIKLNSYNINIFSYRFMYHESIDKKKHHFSTGSRSKSKKSKPNEFSVDLKPHKGSLTMASHDHTHKVKTQNSLNKSKGSRKKSKVLQKPKVKDSKEISRSISVERKHTLTKINKTEANFDSDEYLQKRLIKIQRDLNKVDRPKQANTKQIKNFFQDIKCYIENVSQPLCTFLCYLHELYMSQISPTLDLISPYEELLKKKQELSRSVQEQVRNNEEIYSKLDEQNLQILRLKEKIQQQRQEIEEKKRLQEDRRKQTIADGWMKKNKTTKSDEEEDKEQQDEKIKNQSNLPLSKNLKIDLGKVNKSQLVDYHDEFYSHLDEFSESWRNQAMKEKRHKY